MSGLICHKLYSDLYPWRRNENLLFKSRFLLYFLCNIVFNTLLIPNLMKSTTNTIFGHSNIISHSHSHSNIIQNNYCFLKINKVLNQYLFLTQVKLQCDLYFWLIIKAHFFIKYKIFLFLSQINYWRWNRFSHSLFSTRIELIKLAF